MGDKGRLEMLPSHSVHDSSQAAAALCLFPGGEKTLPGEKSDSVSLGTSLQMACGKQNLPSLCLNVSYKHQMHKQPIHKELPSETRKKNQKELISNR